MRLCPMKSAFGVGFLRHEVAFVLGRGVTVRQGFDSPLRSSLRQAAGEIPWKRLKVREKYSTSAKPTA